MIWRTQIECNILKNVQSDLWEKSVGTSWLHINFIHEYTVNWFVMNLGRKHTAKGNTAHVGEYSLLFILLWRNIIELSPLFLCIKTALAHQRCAAVWSVALLCWNIGNYVTCNTNFTRLDARYFLILNSTIPLTVISVLKVSFVSV